MKKILRQAIFVFGLLMLFGLNVNAERPYYTNLNGVEMTEDEYDKMVHIYSDRKVTSLTQDEFDLIKDARIVSHEKLYVKVISDQNNILHEIYVTEDEYYNAPENLQICGDSVMDSDSGYFATSYKTLSSSLMDLSIYYYLISDLSWTIMPACRSFDIFAFRTTHMSFDYVSGTQTFYVGTSHTNIGYGANSLGYKELNNGAGISMNLEDSTDITGLDLSISAVMNISEYNYNHARVFTTYQHAQSNISREDSMSYTLSAGGLGDVVYFNNYTIQSKYDDMPGIELVIPIQ